MIMRSIFGREQRRNDATDNSCNLKLLTARRCSSLVALNDNDNDAEEEEEGEVNGVVNGNKIIVVRKYSYLKLPQQLLKLTVLKLDGSSFDVNIGRNGTVAELKRAVEEIFTSMPEEGQDKISWSHVWGHFCLSYENQKLINDKACIRNFGMKDGDQLKFVRHMSINYSYSRRSQNQNATHKQLPPSVAAHEEKEQKTAAEHTDMNENQDYNSNKHSIDEEEIPVPEFKLAHFLKGWLSYSRLWGTASRKGSQVQNRPSRFSLQCLGVGPRMIKLQS